MDERASNLTNSSLIRSSLLQRSGDIERDNYPLGRLYDVTQCICPHCDGILLYLDDIAGRKYHRIWQYIHDYPIGHCLMIRKIVSGARL